jgi:transposase
VLDESGTVLLEQRVSTTPKALREVLGTMPSSRIALETGMHSPWVSRLLSEFGHEVIVAHARKVRLIGESRKKDDRLEAQTLARLARIDPQLLCPVKHRSAQAQADLTVIRARAGLVRARTALVNTARGLAKSYGERLRGCNARNLNPEKAESLSPALQAALQPLLAALESLSKRIREYNQLIECLARNSYPLVEHLKQVKGVGTLIALTFVLTLEDAHRFGKSRVWAATWDCNPDAGTPGRASRRCTSAKRVIRTCARCWCKERNTCWARSDRIAICDAGV